MCHWVPMIQLKGVSSWAPLCQVYYLKRGIILAFILMMIGHLKN